MTRRVRRATRVLALAVLGALVLASGGARADDVEEARAYHEKAKTAFALSRYAEAAEYFEKAFELKSDPALLFNAAQSHRLAGNRERALSLYQNYLRVFPRDQNTAAVQARIDELKRSIDLEPSKGSRPPAMGPAEQSSTVPARHEPIPATTPAVALAPAPVLITQAPAAEAERRSSSRTWLWVTLGGVIVAAAVGVAFFALSSTKDPEPTFGRVHGD